MCRVTVILHLKLEGDAAVNKLLDALSPLIAEGSIVVQGERAARVECLTDQERRLLNALTTCDTIAEAARQLCISVGTARKYLVSIYRKLEVHSLHRAVAIAAQSGLLQPNGHFPLEETE